MNITKPDRVKKSKVWLYVCNYMIIKMTIIQHVNKTEKTKIHNTTSQILEPSSLRFWNVQAIYNVSMATNYNHVPSCSITVKLLKVQVKYEL